MAVKLEEAGLKISLVVMQQKQLGSICSDKEKDIRAPLKPKIVVWPSHRKVVEPLAATQYLSLRHREVRSQIVGLAYLGCLTSKSIT